MYGRTTRYPTSMTVPRTATMYPSRTTTDYPPCPCYNGGTCIYGIFCHCPDGYTGIHCQIKDNCYIKECKNGGTCMYSHYHSDFICQCPYQTSGQYCEYTLSEPVSTTVPGNHYPCAYAYCSVNSKCLPGEWTSDYTCLCDPGYTGAYCDIPMEHDCGCIHGTCNYNDYDYSNYYYDYANYHFWSTTETPLARAEGPFTCDCEPSYTGHLCESLITFCNDNPCQNGGYCYDSHNGDFSCECPAYFTGKYCEQGLWGPWEGFGTCSQTCGGGYIRQSRTCLAGYGLCEGRSVTYLSCNTYPCDELPGIDYPAIDVEIDINDASTVTMNEDAVTHAVAYVINHYCSDNWRECCSAFGYSAKPGFFFLVNLVHADACKITFTKYGDVSFIITISAKTSMLQLSQFCDVYSDYSEEPENHEENIYVSHNIMKDAVEENVDTIKSMANVDILSVDYSSSRQIDDDYDDDDDDYHHHGHLKALVIALPVGLTVLVAGFIGKLVCKKRNKPRSNNHPAAPRQPIPTVARPQLYPQRQTPHDHFLFSGVNGMPPSYQEVVMYPPTSPPQYYAAGGIQNSMYGNVLPPRNGSLPPIPKPGEPEPDQAKETDNPEVNNPTPPSATVYNFQTPPIQPAGRLPRIQQA